VLAIARWREVVDARDRVVRAKLDARILELRLQELGARAVANEVGVSHPTVVRRLRATLDEVLAELGSSAPEASAVVVSRPSMCLTCGSRARARRRSMKQKVAGRWIITPERQLGLCVECLPEEKRVNLVATSGAP
jgi:hypothetical protein